MTKPETPADALVDKILLAMAVLSTIIVLVPIGVLAAVLAILGLNVIALIPKVLSLPSLIASISITPTILLITLSAVFLAGYAFRARWTPLIVSILALLWGLTASGATLLIPLLGLPDGLPNITILMMIPGLIGPVLAATGLAGFMLTNNRVRVRFPGRRGTAVREVMPQRMQP